jgi:hypothetical protein
MTMPANVTRDPYLYGASTILHLLKERKAPIRRLVQVAVIAALQSDYHKFYWTGMEILEDYDEDAEVGVGERLFRKFKDTFGNITGGVGARRMQTSGIDFEKVYLNEDGSFNGTMDFVVDVVLDLFHWINSNVGKDTFTPSNIENEVRAAHTRLEGKKTDLGEFRILVICHACFLAGVGIKPHASLRDFLYPVAGLGASQQLHSVDPEKRDEVLKRVIFQFDLHEFGRNGAENCLCEGATWRAGKMKDYLYRGCIRFRIASSGTLLMCTYGSTEWLDCPFVGETEVQRQYRLLGLVSTVTAV